LRALRLPLILRQLQWMTSQPPVQRGTPSEQFHRNCLVIFTLFANEQSLPKPAAGKARRQAILGDRQSQAAGEAVGMQTWRQAIPGARKQNQRQVCSAAGLTWRVD
jgi:hypothetical protein